MSAPLKTALLIEAQTRGADKLDELVQIVRGLGRGAGEADPKLAALGGKLDQLTQQQTLIQRFGELKRVTLDASTAWQQAQQSAGAAARELKRTQAATEAASAAEKTAATALASARKEHEALRQAVADGQTELKALREVVRSSGGASEVMAARVKDTAGQLKLLRGEAAAAGQQVRSLTAEHRAQTTALVQAGQEQGRAEQAMQRAVSSAGRAKAAYEAQRQTLHDTRQTLREAGVNTQQLADVQRDLRAQVQAAASAVEQYAGAMDQADERGRSMREGITSISAQLERAQRWFIWYQGAVAALARAREVIQAADRYKDLSGSIELVNRSAQGFNLTLTDMQALAQRTYSSLGNTTELTGSLARAGEELRVSQQAVLRLTETINKANQIGAASAGAADAAVAQLIQGLQSGVLRGEEFNSVMEQSPRLARALADGLGVPLSPLREMAEQGELTSARVIEALQSQAAAIDAEFGQLPVTVSRALTNLETAWTIFVGRLDDGTGATGALAEGLGLLADGLDVLGENLDVVGSVLSTVAALLITQFGVKAVMALRTYMATQTAATATTTLMATAQTTLAAAAKAAWAAMATSPAFILVGLGELAMAIGYVATHWDELGQKVRTYWEEWQKRREISRSVEDNAQRLAERYAEISRQTGIVVSSMEELNQAQAEGKIYFDQATASWKAGAGPLWEVEKAARATAEASREVGKAIAQAVPSLDPAAQAAREALTQVQQALDTARANAQGALGGMADAYAGLTAQLDAQLTAQLAAIQAKHAQEQALIEASDLSQRDRLKAQTQATLAALQEELTARMGASAETLRLIEEEGAARMQAAASSAQTEEERAGAVRRVENDILTARLGTLEQMLAAQRQHVDALNVEIDRHYAHVARLEEDKRLLALNVEERIREIRRAGMTDAEALADRQKQLAELQSQARQALEQGDFENAQKYGKQAIALAGQVAGEQSRLAKESFDAQGKYAGATLQAKQAVNKSIADILASQKLVNQAIDGEAASHKVAASTAEQARDGMQAQIKGVTDRITELRGELDKGLKLQIEADRSRLDAAMADVEKLLADKTFLLKIDAELQAARHALAEYDAALKSGRALPVDADFQPAQQALADFNQWAEAHGQVSVAVSTAQALKDLGAVQQAIDGLREVTTSQHIVNTNAAAARGEIQALNGADTSSTHTIYVRRVEQKAAGGMAGADLAPRRFAQGGSPAAPVMRQGVVPGAGDTDSVARTLPAGAYVLRKAAVRKYGREGIQRLIAQAKSTMGAAGRAVAGATQQAGRQVGALLMPGEMVVSPQDVARLGVGFFDGLNALVAPPPLRYAQGGAVEDGQRLAAIDRLIDIGLDAAQYYSTMAGRRHGGKSLGQNEVARAIADGDKAQVNTLRRKGRLSVIDQGHLKQLQERWMSAILTAEMEGGDVDWKGRLRQAGIGDDGEPMPQAARPPKRRGGAPEEEADPSSSGVTGSLGRPVGAYPSPAAPGMGTRTAAGGPSGGQSIAEPPQRIDITLDRGKRYSLAVASKADARALENLLRDLELAGQVAQ